MTTVGELFDRFFTRRRVARLHAFGQRTPVSVTFGSTTMVVEGLSGELPFAVEFAGDDTFFFLEGENRNSDAARAEAKSRAEPAGEHGARIFLLVDPRRVLETGNGEDKEFEVSKGFSRAEFEFDVSAISPAIPGETLLQFGLASLDRKSAITLAPPPTVGGAPAPRVLLTASSNARELLTFTQPDMTGRPELRFR